MADLWDGVPADLRAKVEAFGNEVKANHPTTELVALVAALRELVRDKERLDWLDTFEAEGYGLISDDGGRWALSSTGIQNVPEAEAANIWSSFLITAEEWKSSAREAIDAGRLEGEATPQKGESE